MTEVDNKLYWNGKPIDDMPPLALLAIIRCLWALLQGSRATSQALDDLLSAAQRSRS